MRKHKRSGRHRITALVYDSFDSAQGRLRMHGVIVLVTIKATADCLGLTTRLYFLTVCKTLENPVILPCFLTIPLL